MRLPQSPRRRPAADAPRAGGDRARAGRGCPLGRHLVGVRAPVRLPGSGDRRRGLARRTAHRAARRARVARRRLPSPRRARAAHRLPSRGAAPTARARRAAARGAHRPRRPAGVADRAETRLRRAAVRDRAGRRRRGATSRARPRDRRAPGACRAHQRRTGADRRARRRISRRAGHGCSSAPSRELSSCRPRHPAPSTARSCSSPTAKSWTRELPHAMQVSGRWEVRSGDRRLLRIRTDEPDAAPSGGVRVRLGDPSAEPRGSTRRTGSTPSGRCWCARRRRDSGRANSPSGPVGRDGGARRELPSTVELRSLEDAPRESGAHALRRHRVRCGRAGAPRPRAGRTARPRRGHDGLRQERTARLLGARARPRSSAGPTRIPAGRLQGRRRLRAARGPPARRRGGQRSGPHHRERAPSRACAPSCAAANRSSRRTEPAPSTSVPEGALARLVIVVDEFAALVSLDAELHVGVRRPGRTRSVARAAPRGVHAAARGRRAGVRARQHHPADLSAGAGRGRQRGGGRQRGRGDDPRSGARARAAHRGSRRGARPVRDLRAVGRRRVFGRAGRTLRARPPVPGSIRSRR